MAFKDDQQRKAVMTILRMLGRGTRLTKIGDAVHTLRAAKHHTGLGMKRKRRRR